MIKRKKRADRIERKEKKRGMELNYGTFLLFFGLVLLVINFLFTKIFYSGAQREINFYISLGGLFLIYIGAVLYFILSGDKPCSKSWNYIKECKNFILFILVVFLFSVLIAFYFQPPEVVDFIKQFIEDILKQTQGLGTWQMIVFILNNNLSSAFFSMIFGLILGIFPVLTAFTNGYILGFVADKVIAIEGISVLWRLAPHGIFEIPALIISLALGTKLGFFITAGRDKIKKEFLRRLQESLRVFLFIIMPLLIIAAIIEGILIVMVG